MISMSHSPGYAISSPNNSLWYHLKNINDQRISKSIMSLYGDHFPIQIRDSLAEWIERQKWEELDASIPGHISEAQQLYSDMVVHLSRIKDSIMDFNEKGNWEEIINRIQQYEHQPFKLVEQMQNCLQNERQLLQEYQGNLSPQPSPAASIPNTNSPDTSKLVTSPSGSQVNASSSKEHIDGSIQKIFMWTHDAENLLKTLEHHQEYFVIHINESHKIQAMVTHHSQQPVNPQVLQALRQKAQESELLLSKEVEGLQQMRVKISSQFRIILTELTSVLNVVVHDELMHWKRMQNLALGLDSAANAEEILSQLQSWFENLADLLWRNKQFIKQFHRLKAQLPMNENEMQEEYNQTIDNLLSYLLRNSFLVEKQPPQVLKTNTRFSSTVRLLVGGKLNIHMNPPEVIATIISEKQAKALVANPDSIHTNEISCGQMLNNKRAMEYNPNCQTLSATFSNMSVKNIKRLEKKGSETVTDEKCAILMRSNIILTGSDMYCYVSTISLPVAVVVHGSQLSSAEGTMFWDKAFSDVNREPFLVPNSVPWSALAKALNAYFFNVTGGSLSDANLDYLWKKIPNVSGDDSNSSIISWQCFNKDNLFMAGKKREPFTFFDWFYGICELLKKHLSCFWKENYIFGFMSKIDAQEMLISQPVGTFLLRFSETETGGISVAWVTQDAKEEKKVWFLAPWFVKDLQIRPFADRLLDLIELSGVYTTLHKVVSKDNAFSKFYSPPTELSNKGPLEYVTTQMKLTLNDAMKQKQAQPHNMNYTDITITDRNMSHSSSPYSQHHYIANSPQGLNSHHSINSPQSSISSNITNLTHHSPNNTGMGLRQHTHPLLADISSSLVYQDEAMGQDEYDHDDIDMILSTVGIPHNY